MSGRTSCLAVTNAIIGIILALASVAGIGLCLYLIFVEEPYSPQDFQGTYEPNWEDIGKCNPF